MEGIIDIHNHIIFGVDDGAKNIEEALEIIEEEYNQGVRKIICTPHFQGGVYEAKPEEIQKKFHMIRECVKEKYSDLELYKGNEILLSGNISELLKTKRVCQLADSRYILVEFTQGVEYSVLETKIRDVLLEGYIPIIAHCERYTCLQKSVDRIEHLVEVGAYMQINAKTALTFKGRRFIKKLIDADCLHFIASDAHGIKKRGVHFNECVTLLEKKYGKEYVRWLLIENPQKILDNRYI